MTDWQFQTPGIPDEIFIRGEVPMTKEEVRAVTMAKLRLKEDSIVYDIGAGTGSLTIEAALLASKGQVWAIERESKGIELIEKNINKFGLDNVGVIAGKAPSALNNLPPVDRVIIGGSGGKLEEILEVVNQKLEPAGRIVINAITLETLSAAKDILLDLNYSLDIVNISVTRTREVGNYHMLQGQNPVYIITGERRR
ncbi:MULTISPECIES: precorrin-6Y C5,15-methyltransferase (decarboxylating) subunit CbiT [unclassified Candidatus Frackibacter]|uniref:precorrin-6Y C5,15-methyltransferase (decarboxylating) subunit CbiT n=1 Tax=unclassified Candidatus Frackibacter TaxID=2648818 RepID=UPI0007994477|nr:MULTISPECIES: precorrin-6Y C5,15-methyltransferase (decarboxylating) subunit CbiT [unclassified Candidatus Frackibacter]KXS43888.1 MAG: cobalt-precorrin-7 (C15)-methyltransferase [Candidatus Frackibacter sp. T328-2]SDC33947.1 cobalt-precorrin 7 C15-methyltransferase [Candidatus Frackibacter sp. WG11]SFL70020.1 cobalt-precorrin 7 C15-methyltransferase [Candidatus Frackibacter sp. WG13]